MNPTPSPSGPASNLKAQAKEAVAALKNEDYGEAIALIEPLLAQATQPSTEAYLRRHLAKAYIGLDDALSAFHQCDYLRQNPDPEVRKWAQKAIDHLRTQYPYIENSATPVPSPVSMGFIPLSEKEEGRRQKAEIKAEGRRQKAEVEEEVDGTQNPKSKIQNPKSEIPDVVPRSPGF